MYFGCLKSVATPALSLQVGHEVSPSPTTIGQKDEHTHCRENPLATGFQLMGWEPIWGYAELMSPCIHIIKMRRSLTHLC